MPEPMPRPSRRLRAAARARGAAADPVAESIPRGMRVASAWSWRILLVAAVVALVLFLIAQLREIIVPLLVAVVLAALLVPFKNFLVRHRWPRWAAIVVAEVGTLVAVAALIYLVATQVAAGFGDVRDRAVSSFMELRRWLEESPLHLTDQQFDQYVAQAWQAIQDDASSLARSALSVGTTFGHVLVGALLVLFATLFILIDGERIWGWIVRVFPRRARLAVDGAGKAGWTTLRSFVKVQILVALIDAIGIATGAAILGVPLAIPIGVLVFLGSFIPIVGAVVTGAFAVFIALVYNGWVIALIMLGVVLLVQQIEGHVLQPLVMGTAVKVHPLAVVLAVAGGSMIAGIAGAFFAVPVVATLNVMIKYVASGQWRTDGRAPRAPVSDPGSAPRSPRRLRTRSTKDTATP
ncbi:AI-2E family transporter [Humibacter sp. BT305]|nr:AI-2E family transporter [Humibacter sp. BT305]